MKTFPHSWGNVNLSLRILFSMGILLTFKVKVKLLSGVRLFVTPWTIAQQAPPSMGFSRQEYWSRVPLPSLFSCNLRYLPPGNTLCQRRNIGWGTLYPDNEWACVENGQNTTGATKRLCLLFSPLLLQRENIPEYKERIYLLISKEELESIREADSFKESQQVETRRGLINVMVCVQVQHTALHIMGERLMLIIIS